MKKERRKNEEDEEEWAGGKNVSVLTPASLVLVARPAQGDPGKESISRCSLLSPQPSSHVHSTYGSPDSDAHA